jgi:hypothetical protein
VGKDEVSKAGCCPAPAGRTLVAISGVRRLPPGIVFLALLSFAQPVSSQDSSWTVAAATHRFEVEIATPASQPEAGNVALLPDGGLLPKPACDVVVTDAGGRELRSLVVWHNPRVGLGVCFETPPSTSRAFVYILPAQKTKPADPAAAGYLKPGLLMYIETSAASPSLAKAASIAKDWPPGRNARLALVPNVGQSENRLGPDDNFMSWYTGWLTIDKPGRYYFCTISDDASEFRIGGKLVARWPANRPRKDGAKGQFGDHVDMEKGLHALEYLQYETTDKQEAHLCWRPTGTPMDKLPLTVPRTAYLHSGETRIVSAASRDHLPLPVFDWQCVKYVWIGDRPLNLFRFSRVPGGQPPSDVRFTWRIDEKYEVTESEFLWFWEDEAEHPVTLTSARGSATASSTAPVVVPVYPPQMNLNVPADRDMVRRAFLSRLQAGPVQRRPCADWSSNLWATLVAALDPYAAPEIPQAIIERSRQDLARVSPEWRWAIEGMFVENVRVKDPSAALPWVQRFAREEMDTSRKVHWQLERARILASDLGKIDEARAALAEIQPATLTPETAVRATVLAGDVERFAGRREEAARFYGAAQDRYRSMQKSAATLSALRRESTNEMSAMAKLAGDWRIAAVREGANHATVQSLLGQKAWAEARRALDQWEIEFPLSKIEGDFPLAEAAFHMAVGDHLRARRILSSYRAIVEMNSYLARAFTMEMQCLEALGLRAEMDALAKERAKRIPTGSASGGMDLLDRQREEMRRKRR